MTPILERLGVMRDRTLVLPFGIDLEKFPFRPREELFGDGIRAVCNRSLGSPVYDIPTDLRGVAGARQRGADVRLSLPGTGRLAGEMKNLAAELGIADTVAFGAGYSNDQVPAMLADHDVYISASHWDGASISLMEAMACGIFPVVSDIPANREWLEDGETGLFFRPGDAQALAEILADLPGRRDLIARAVQANRETILRRADRRANLATLLNALESAAGAARGGRAAQPHGQ
jgi:glycosyltransferase involved in cell wall biosynthesis